MPDDKLKATLHQQRPGFSVEGWSVDRLARVWLIIQPGNTPQTEYFRRIENLFLAAEVNELVALYSALPLLPWPELWKRRCSEGIRSNIADVLTAIMCNNPYASENLDEPAWNQLVLKAFFTEKPIDQIVGLDQRSNKQLAQTLSDYAHERWAAHRAVNPMLWRCVGPFIDQQIVGDIQKIASSENPLENEAAALSAVMSGNPGALALIPADLLNAAKDGRITWNHLAQKITNYVLQ